MRSSTFDHEDTPQDDKHATEVGDSMAEDSEVGREVSAAAVEPRRRKNVTDVESQTEDTFIGRKSENPGAISESTQSTLDSQTLAQHPFNSCTAVNCLICATIGKNNF